MNWEINSRACWNQEGILVPHSVPAALLQTQQSKEQQRLEIVKKTWRPENNAKEQKLDKPFKAEYAEYAESTWAHCSETDPKSMWRHHCPLSWRDCKGPVVGLPPVAVVGVWLQTPGRQWQSPSGPSPNCFSQPWFHLSSGHGRDELIGEVMKCDSWEISGK